MMRLQQSILSKIYHPDRIANFNYKLMINSSRLTKYKRECVRHGFHVECYFYVYIAAIIAYVVREIWRTKTLRWVAFGVFSGALVLNTILVLTRWYESKSCSNV